MKSAIETKAILKIGLKIPLLSSIFKKKLKEAAGFSNLSYAGTGAAPINPDILTLFQSLDINLFEGYGMTENTAVATVNYVGNNKIGTVGLPLDGTEVKIADDGEILLKGDHVMKGYYNNEDATNNVLNAAKDVVGENVISPYLSMGGEDFSYFANKVPGCFFFLGSSPKDRPPMSTPQHCSHFNIEESAMLIGSSIFIHLACK